MDSKTKSSSLDLPTILEKHPSYDKQRIQILCQLHVGFLNFILHVT